MTIDLEGVGKAKLTIYCLIGSPPPAKAEGVIVDAGPMHFNEVVFSPTLFIRA